LHSSEEVFAGMKSKITKIKKSHDVHTPADRQKGILSLFGTIDYDSDYDYKKTRKRTYEIIGPFHSVDDLMKSLNDE